MKKFLPFLSRLFKNRVLSIAPHAGSRVTEPRVALTLACAALLVLFGTTLRAWAARSAMNIEEDAIELRRAASSTSRVLAQAEADFSNAQPEAGETAWGKLVADAMKSVGQADVALLNAEALTAGTVKKGAVTQRDVDALLTYADDEMVVVNLNGTQLKAALEYALRDAPHSSPRFLHIAGMKVVFDGAARKNKVRRLLISGADVQADDTFSVAMPMALAQGGSGYFTVWGKLKAVREIGALNEVMESYLRQKKTIAPDGAPRYSTS